MSLLKRIESPADLKKLSRDQFPELCQEIRELIIEVISHVGGAFGLQFRRGGVDGGFAVFIEHARR
ncbi:1-deoxy-D-xylulose-5-phosphate synthase N-terminal domain-containing protein [Candidatus Nitrospira allomarina]|uniref:1-deoxy-D-xylulose-5-phosphate synthase N-terminal domain-containing protein n=1 Tax=Candidatus Nitrospira allomarina TaxID=3020900 RepID=A0AA96JXR4_9BACT|nr:1-deoxy-D-xylulose-5-phosphate synthase N-terminal domain-containing protein [Candidatus Nitrospira allomarina]WNM59356.1 1-deoxy-D-xylulose-5-phosphate synthase N-terminal domain-containing protein [Candidatus Nitrospira allomarina]